MAVIALLELVGLAQRLAASLKPWSPRRERWLEAESPKIVSAGLPVLDEDRADGRGQAKLIWAAPFPLVKPADPLARRRIDLKPDYAPKLGCRNLQRLAFS